MKTRWLIAVVLMLFAADAGAETVSERIHAAALKRANQSYNDRDYAAAIPLYVEAIQAHPTEPRAYRNLARAYFWKGEYAISVQYYDHYLRLATDDVEREKSERRLAAERASGEVYTLPESQRMALAMLEREIESGRVYTTGGGGAWGIYSALLRTGYAEPHLARVRAELTRRLLDEVDLLLMPAAGQLTPRLDLEGWQLQAARLDAASRVVADAAVADMIAMRSTVCEAAIAMLTSQWQNASRLFALAREQNPDLRFLMWFELATLIDGGKPDVAIERIDTLLPESPDEERLNYLRILRGAALQRLDRANEATSLYYDVLRR